METAQDLDLGPFLTNIYGDRYLHTVNRDVFNKKGSKEIYRSYFSELFSAPSTLYVVLGSDSGLMLNWLDGLKLSPGSRILVLELPDVLARLGDVVDLDGLNEKISIGSYKNLEEQLDLLGFSPYVYRGSIKVVDSLAVAGSYIAAYSEMAWECRQKIDFKAWRLKGELGLEVYVRCQLDNLAEDRRPAFCLDGHFSGKTAVILAGGPSLDEALPWVLEHREKFVVISISRIARRLLEVGLTPHMIFTGDPLKASFDVSKEMLQFGPEVVMVHAYHANPALVGQWQGDNLYLGPRFPWRTELNVKNYDVHGVMSITNAALVVARRMGFSKIIFCGLDLCFSKEGYTHASGSREHAAGPTIVQQMLTVETNSGFRANTRNDFKVMMEDLAVQAVEARVEGCRLINVSPGAAKIDGIEYQPPGQIELPSDDLLIRPIIRQALPDDSAPSRCRDLETVISELKRVRFRLKRIKALSREALECNDGLFGRKGKKADFKYKKKMDKIENRLNRDFSDLVPLVKGFGLAFFIKDIRPDSTAEWTDEEIETAGRNYYEAYISSSKALLELVENAQYRVQSRLEELSKTPDVSRLLDQWEADKMPGRAKLWLDQNREIQVPDEIGKRLDLMTQEFLSLITQPLAVKKEARFNPEAVRRQAVLLFHRRSINGLKTLLAGLEAFKDLDGAQDLKYITSGYIFEIEGDYSRALEAYQPLIRDDVHPLLEEALNRIGVLSLELQHDDDALIAVECLANISVAYQPKHAELLKRLGRFLDAVDVYGDYLAKVPDDLSAMLQLGRLYMDMNVKEAAGMAFRHVLEKDPENSAARALLKKMGQDNV